MKNLMFTVLAAFLLTSNISAQNCQDSNIPNRPVPGLISMVHNYFGDEAVGQIYDFNLKPFSKVTGHHVILKFDLAYTYFPGRYDSLAILVSSDCGKSWETLLYSGGEELSTTDPTPEYFLPNRSEYESYQFDLYRYSGPILVRFRFINGNGNNLYLDNLGFQDGLSDVDDAPGININLYPNPFRDYALLSINPPVTQGTLLIMDSTGREIQHMDHLEGSEIQLEGNEFAPGLYYYTLMQGRMKTHGQFAIVD